MVLIVHYHRAFVSLAFEVFVVVVVVVAAVAGLATWWFYLLVVLTLKSDIRTSA